MSPTCGMVRGDKHNGLDWRMFVALNEAIDEVRGAAERARGRALGRGPELLRRAGHRQLQAPTAATADNAEGGRTGLAGDGSPRARVAANFAQRVAYGWRELAVPVIAALRGACLGGGLQIALGADVRIAAPDTRLSVMEIVHGLIPDMSITQTLPRLVGDDVARELVFTGRKVEAAEALELGLVTRISRTRRAARSGGDERGPPRRRSAGQAAAAGGGAPRQAPRSNEAPSADAAREALALGTELQRDLLGHGPTARRAPLRGRISPRAALRPPHGWFRCGSKRGSGRSHGASTRWRRSRS